MLLEMSLGVSKKSYRNVFIISDRALVIFSGCSAQTLTVGMHAEVCGLCHSEPKERHCLTSKMQEDFAYQVDR